MGDKNLNETRLDELKKRVEEIKEEYGTDYKSFFEKMKSNSELKTQPKKTNSEKLFGSGESKPLFDKNEVDEYINKLREKK